MNQIERKKKELPTTKNNLNKDIFQLSLEDQTFCNSKIKGTYLCYFQISLTLTTPLQKNLGAAEGIEGFPQK